MIGEQSSLLQSDLEKIIGNIQDLSIRRSVSGSALTTMAVGGPLSYLIEPQTEEALCSVVSAFYKEGVPFRILGAGSNIVMPDNGLNSPVIKLGRGFKATQIDGSKIIAGGAAALMPLSRAASESALEGLEFAGGIPASIGGAVRMNAGAHGGDMASVLESVRVVLPNGNLEVIKASSLIFSYRKASIPEGAIITEATFRLTPGDKDISDARRAKFLADRKANQPLTLPSSGSVFRNPDPIRTAGKILDECGAKGLQKGGAMVSELHANWIVNPKKDATAKDVAWLVQECQNLARDKAKIELEPELLIWA